MNFGFRKKKNLHFLLFLANSLWLWGKWHNYDEKQSKCPNFFSSGHKICALSCVPVWRRKSLSLAPIFQQFFREIGKVVLIPAAWGNHWTKRSASAAMLFCIHAISIIGHCVSELHFLLGSDTIEMLWFAPSGT